ncbi:MAG: CoA-binding protein [Candidatus Bilamarchaeaceae archaeon]
MVSRKMANRINKILEPKSVAIIGASAVPGKIGNVILRNLLDGKYQGKIYPINPKYENVLGLRCYRSVLEVKESVDCAIIAIPAEAVPQVVEECGRKGVGGALILSGGFEEIGRRDLAVALRKSAEENDMPIIGPNCLGVFNPYNRMDSIFFPMYKLGRPGLGSVSFITQSGAVGSVIIDVASYYGIGIAKFISYGNATVINETDLLEYLGKDEKTKLIVLYLEAVRDGRRLLNTMQRINKKKPIIVLKAGRGRAGQEAARSHTGNIAGNYLAYQAAFRQARVTEARSLDELFDLMKIFSQPLAKGRKIGIITNGGGLGVLTTDAVEEEGLMLARLKEETVERLRRVLPNYSNVSNPLDLVADASVELYDKAIEEFNNDSDVDFIIICALLQTPTMNEEIINVLIKAAEDKRKPIAVVSVGGAYTESYRKILESKGVPIFNSPNSAVKAVKKFIEYSENMTRASGKRDL